MLYLLNIYCLKYEIYYVIQHIKNLTIHAHCYHSMAFTKTPK